MTTNLQPGFYWVSWTHRPRGRFIVEIIKREEDPDFEIYRTEDEVPIPLGALKDWRRVEPEETK